MLCGIWLIKLSSLLFASSNKAGQTGNYYITVCREGEQQLLCFLPWSYSATSINYSFLFVKYILEIID